MDTFYLLAALLIYLLVWIFIATILYTMHHNSTLPSEADIVIVGGGVAGCVLARRLLLKYPNKNIVILDRGKDFRNDRNIYRPEAAGIAAYNAPYSTQISPDFPGVICSFATMYGGGSSHNYGLKVVGSEDFYKKEWSQVASLTEISDAKTKIDALVPATPLHISLCFASRIIPVGLSLLATGFQPVLQSLDVITNIGPLRANQQVSNWINNSFVQNSPYPISIVEDYNKVGPCVTSTPQLFVDKNFGVRASINRAYLPLNDVGYYLKIENVTIDHINYKEKIEIFTNDGRKIIAKEKVIMAAGAVFTPYILMKSDILPNPVNNLTTHYGTTMILAVKNTDDFSSGPMAFIPNNLGERNWQVVTSGSTLTNLDFLRSQGVDVNYLPK